MSRSRRLAIAAAAVVLLAAGTAAAFLTMNRRDVTTTSKEAYRLYQIGLEDEQKMYMREAVEAYAGALAKDPHFVMATLRLAAAIRSRDPDRAKSLVNGAERYRDELTERERLTLDAFEAQMNRDQKAFERIIDTYLKRFPTDPDGYQSKAEILAKSGKVDEAAKVYEQLVAVNPNYARAYNNLGYYAMGRGEWARSEDYFKRYRFLAPDQANPFDSLGELYANTGRYEEARASLKQALAVKPDFAASVAHLGTVLVGEGKLPEAAVSYREAASIGSTPEQQLEFGFDAVFAWLFARQPDEATRELARVEDLVRAAPDSQQKVLATRVAFFRAAVAATAGETAQTASSLAEAQALAAQDPDAKSHWQGAPETIRAVLERTRGDCPEALKDFAVPLQLADEHDAIRRRGGSFPYFPTDDLVRVDAAECLARLGRKDEAQAQLAKILARNPRFQPALAVASQYGLPGGRD